MIFLLDLTNAHSNSSSLCTNLIKRKAIFVHEKLQFHGDHHKHHHKSFDISNNTQMTTDFKSWNFRHTHDERHHRRLIIVRTSFFMPFFLFLQRRIQDFNLEGWGSIFVVLPLNQLHVSM